MNISIQYTKEVIHFFVMYNSIYIRMIQVLIKNRDSCDRYSYNMIVSTLYIFVGVYYLFNLYNDLMTEYFLLTIIN